MTRKHTAKQKRRLARKRKRQKYEDTGLLQKIKKSNLFPEVRVIRKPPGKEKMSEVIWNYAEPLLEQVNSDDLTEKIIGFAILVWNISFLPEKSRKEEVEKVILELSPLEDSETANMLRSQINMLMERKAKYFSKYNNRYIIDYKITYEKGKTRLFVASTIF